MRCWRLLVLSLLLVLGSQRPAEGTCGWWDLLTPNNTIGCEEGGYPCGRVGVMVSPLGDLRHMAIFGGVSATGEALNDVWLFSSVTNSFTLVQPQGSAGLSLPPLSTTEIPRLMPCVHCSAIREDDRVYRVP